VPVERRWPLDRDLAAGGDDFQLSIGAMSDRQRDEIVVMTSAMPSLGHTFYLHCTLMPCDRSHSPGRRMTVELPPRPTELRDVKSPRQRPPVDGSNEFAALAAQLAARNEQRRAGGASAAPPTGVDYEEDREEAASSLSSLLASHPVAATGGGVLLLVMATVAVLVFQDRPFQASTPLPANRIEQAKADIPAAGTRDVTVPSSVPAPPASPRTVASPPPEPPRAAASAPAVTSPLPAAPPTAAKEPVKATPESPPSVSQIPSTPEPRSAPLTPDEIRELQGKLKAAGFNPGAIDGVVGPQTRSALRNYAQSRSLQNAEATRDLLARLSAEPGQQRPAQEPAVSSPVSQSEASNSSLAAPARPDEPRKTMCTAEVGRWPTDRTDQAKAIQSLLRDLGFFGGPIYGTVGPATRAAIRKFQLAAGETETGEPSEALFEQLKRKCTSSAR
jgi:peptidoglycan hydrolase-like protein with peptidoglycan-binding domain